MQELERAGAARLAGETGRRRTLRAGLQGYARLLNADCALPVLAISTTQGRLRLSCLRALFLRSGIRVARDSHQTALVNSARAGNIRFFWK